MNIVVLRETLPGEARVALMPESVKKLVALKASVLLRVAPDWAPRELTTTTARQALKFPPTAKRCLNPQTSWSQLTAPQLKNSPAQKQRSGAGFFPSARRTGGVETCLDTRVDHVCDGIGSAHHARAGDGRAFLNGHGRWIQSGVVGAAQIPRMFPLLMTAAGTVPPARVLVLGAGVAGLQAIATARRLGAVVEAYDVRAAAGEQVRSLGAKFLGSGSGRDQD